MKITCVQFEGLIAFYLNNELSESLRKNFEEHMKICPTCAMRFNLLSDVLAELKQRCSVFDEHTALNDNISSSVLEAEDKKGEFLSAYIDNELSYDLGIKMRRAIISNPLLKNKAENIYKLKNILSKSFNTCKDKIKTDYSKNVMRSISGKKSFISLNYILFLCGVIIFSLISYFIIWNMV